ncbi:hypothetical protein SAMN04489726_6662 [Allokutzneria albata]|uniref:DUF3558 domain-containing protein n=1 Tax=Allokutzneria albata TaxID=211114 RepID=A0A1H0BGR3_ALLAB|nr:hypothetical protein SAMN04489726_6662 [Allokutzneria albata]
MAALLLTGCTKNADGAAPPKPERPVPSLELTRPPASGTEVDPVPTTSGAPLITGVVEDECLLTAAEFSALVGQPVSPGRNTQLDLGPEGQKRSCFYPTEASGLPKNWINVYGTTGQHPSELVQRANKNTPGSKLLTDIGLGAVTVPAALGAPGGDMYVATEKYLLEIHVGEGVPDEPRWIVAGTALVAKAPA